MNIQTLSKQLHQKYIKDIDSSAGKVGPYYFTVEPSNQIALIRVTFYVEDANRILDELKEEMANHRAIGRDGVHVSGHELIIQCKINGLDHYEEFATILETVGNLMYKNDIKQVDSSGNVGDNLGVFRVGTKLEVHNDESINDISETVGKRYKNSNQSRFKAFLNGFGWFLLLMPAYVLVRAFEPSFFGFAIFSYPVLVMILRKSLNGFYKKLSPTKLDLAGLFVGYVILMHLAYIFTATVNIIYAMPLFGIGSFFFISTNLLLSGGQSILDSLITLAFAMAFNYHIVRSMIDGASNQKKPIKRSIHRVI